MQDEIEIIDDIQDETEEFRYSVGQGFLMKK